MWDLVTGDDQEADLMAGFANVLYRDFSLGTRYERPIEIDQRYVLCLH
jgi:hypothetical protein